MKSLSERHADRASRKAENAAESTAGNVSGRVANAANLMERAQVAFAGLSDDERRELQEAYSGADPVDGFKSLAEDDEGNYKYAGIGVVNPLVVPAAEQPAPVSLSEVEARAGNGGGWGDGNANGRAVEAAASGWGDKPADDGKEGEEAPKSADKPAADGKAAKPAK